MSFKGNTSRKILSDNCFHESEYQHMANALEDRQEIDLPFILTDDHAENKPKVGKDCLDEDCHYHLCECLIIFPQCEPHQHFILKPGTIKKEIDRAEICFEYNRKGKCVDGEGCDYNTCPMMSLYEECRDGESQGSLKSFMLSALPLFSPMTVNPTPTYITVFPIFPVHSIRSVESASVPNDMQVSSSRSPLGLNVITLPQMEGLDFWSCKYRNDDRRGRKLNRNKDHFQAGSSSSHFSERVRNNSHGSSRQDPDADVDQLASDWNNSVSQPHRFILCYICGRKYGTASISIHEKQCLEKWRRENTERPKHLQRPEPVKPQIVLDNNVSQQGPGPSGMLTGTGRYNLDAINDAAFAAAQTQYVKCNKCGRSFQPDRLEVHSKNCRGFHKIM